MSAVLRPGAPAPKPKTRAKQRYLKAKKERRKARKSVGPRPFGEGKKKRHSTDTDEAVKRVRVEEQQALEREADDTAQHSSENDSSDEEMSHSSSSDEADKPVTTSETRDNELSHIRADPLQPDETPKYLYRFPRPRNTATVNEQLLAAQGVPEALARPTDVSASETQPLQATADTPDARGVALSSTVRRRLDDLGITEWFAVQGSVIPLLLNDTAASKLYLPYAPPRDLCVSAPTGSGKTLAYTVPIVELLQRRVLVQLRALVLVPTRDLAVQVAEMFDAVGKGSGLRVALVTGNHRFRHEQDQLVDATGQSRVDVLIATPGRLVDHLRGTPRFTLEHLRFLVIDEADRLLGQSFQQWVPTLLSALEPHPHDGLAAPQTLYAECELCARDDLEAPQTSVQKMLFSATLTSDPAKMGALCLRNPHYIRVRDPRAAPDAPDSFALPAGLQEHMVILPSSDKVLHLLRLLHEPAVGPVRQALCFTKSVDAANRLVRLITFFEESFAAEQGTSPLQAQFYSSDLSASERMQMLRRFQQGGIDLLVCSDLIARGIDLPEVRHVVSYDVPVDMAKYVHRVGRTARAGRTGDAWSLVEEQEVYHFKRMLRENAHLDNVRVEKVRQGELDAYMPSYRKALAQLASVYSQQR